MKSLDRDRQKLNEACRSGILFLRSKGWTYKKIGLRVGYKDGNVASTRIDQIVNQGGLPGPVKLMKLSRLLSEEGYDEVADLFSAPSKAAVPVGASNRNRSLLEETSKIVESLGTGSEAFRQRRIQDAEIRARALVAGSMEFLDEVLDAKQRWAQT